MSATISKPFTLSPISEHFRDEDAARDFLESYRWPSGAVCPHCGEVGNAGKLTARSGSKRPVRKGVWKCYGCLEQFSVTVGTVFEDSHVPLHKWLLAAYLMVRVLIHSHASLGSHP